MGLLRAKTHQTMALSVDTEPNGNLNRAAVYKNSPPTSSLNDHVETRHENGSFFSFSELNLSILFQSCFMGAKGEGSDVLKQL